MVGPTFYNQVSGRRKLWEHACDHLCVTNGNEKHIDLESLVTHQKQNALQSGLASENMRKDLAKENVTIRNVCASETAIQNVLGK